MTHEAPRALAARIRAEIQSLRSVHERIESAMAALDQPSVQSIALDSAALNIHDLYVGLERIFEAIADNVDRSVPDGATWHRDLLQQMTVDVAGLRSAVVPPGMREDLARLLGFRHIVRNVYSYELDREGVEQNAARVRRVFPVLANAIDSFADWLESLDERA